MKLLVAIILLSAQALALTPLQAMTRAKAMAASITGAEVLAVAHTGSMEPSIHERCLLVFEPVKFTALRKGDAVVFADPLSSGTMVHRLMRVTRKGWLTKGDNCATFDAGHVTEANLVGRVVAVVYFQP